MLPISLCATFALTLFWTPDNILMCLFFFRFFFYFHSFPFTLFRMLPMLIWLLCKLRFVRIVFLAAQDQCNRNPFSFLVSANFYVEIASFRWNEKVMWLHTRIWGIHVWLEQIATTGKCWQKLRRTNSATAAHQNCAQLQRKQLAGAAAFRGRNFI